MRASTIMEETRTTAALAKVMIQRAEAGERLCDVGFDVRRSSGRSESSLLSAFRRVRLGAPHLHCNYILTAAEDRALVYTAQVFSYAYAALTLTDLSGPVKELWD